MIARLKYYYSVSINVNIIQYCNYEQCAQQNVQLFLPLGSKFYISDMDHD